MRPDLDQGAVNGLSVYEPSFVSRVGAFLRFSPVIEAVEADRVSSAEAELILLTPCSTVCSQYLTGPGGGPDYGCRCTVCRAANAAKSARLRAQQQRKAWDKRGDGGAAST